MKKAYLPISICVLLFMFLSCKQGIFEQYRSDHTGTVFLNLSGGSARSVNADGLPDLKDTEMFLEVVSSGGSETKRFPAKSEKIWQGSFPIGERITVKVTVKNSSAEWKGRTEHTVAAGIHSISIALNKRATGLNKLLFGVSKGDSNTVFTFVMEGKEISERNASTLLYTSLS